MYIPMQSRPLKNSSQNQQQILKTREPSVPNHCSKISLEHAAQPKTLEQIIRFLHTKNKVNPDIMHLLENQKKLENSELHTTLQSQQYSLAKTDQQPLDISILFERLGAICTIHEKIKAQSIDLYFLNFLGRMPQSDFDFLLKNQQRFKNESLETLGLATIWYFKGIPGLSKFHDLDLSKFPRLEELNAKHIELRRSSGQQVGISYLLDEIEKEKYPENDQPIPHIMVKKHYVGLKPIYPITANLSCRAIVKTEPSWFTTIKHILANQPGISLLFLLIIEGIKKIVHIFSSTSKTPNAPTQNNGI